MTANNIYLGVIVIIVIIIIAFFAWRYWRKSHGKDGFSYSTPATPRVREAVGDLYASLKHMVALGRSFEAQAAALRERLDANALPSIDGARQGAALVVRALDRAEKSLSGAPPTYANYLAVYRGMTSTDQALLASADAYSNAGYAIHQRITHDPLALTAGDAASLGNTLISMGRQLRQVVSAVHRLGVALDVE